MISLHSNLGFVFNISRNRLIFSLVSSTVIFFIYITLRQEPTNYWCKNTILLISTVFLLFYSASSGLEHATNIHKKIYSSFMHNRFYSAAVTLYLISLFSSSFIEEEHQIWYYLETTQFYLILFWNGSKWTKSTDYARLALLIAVTRVLRSINQTGNKWIHLKDIGDFLRE